MHKPYRDFADFLHERFPDFKVQKIAINAGFTCPNRDGSKGTGGCTYCNNQTFNPARRCRWANRLRKGAHSSERNIPT